MAGVLGAGEGHEQQEAVDGPLPDRRDVNQNSRLRSFRDPCGNGPTCKTGMGVAAKHVSDGSISPGEQATSDKITHESAVEAPVLIWNDRSSSG